MNLSKKLLSLSGKIEEKLNDEKGKLIVEGVLGNLLVVNINDKRFSCLPRTDVYEFKEELTNIYESSGLTKSIRFIKDNSKFSEITSRRTRFSESLNKGSISVKND